MIYKLEDLLYLMSRLRDPDGGCPWDLAQNFQSITASTIEEAYELVDAINLNDQQQIKEELGDLLLQIVFYTQLGKESGWFMFDDIVDVLTKKLIRRHPHVFPKGQLHQRFDQALDAEQVNEQWEKIKEEERREKSQHRVLDDIPRALPALKRAQKIQKRVSKVGFDWPGTASAMSKVSEELEELKQAIDEQDDDNMQEEMGDLLFSMVNIARHIGIDAESALDGSNRKFEQRFGFIENALKKQQKTPEQASLAEMDLLWDEAKKNSAQNPFFD